MLDFHVKIQMSHRSSPSVTRVPRAPRVPRPPSLAGDLGARGGAVYAAESFRAAGGAAQAWSRPSMMTNTMAIIMVNV